MLVGTRTSPCCSPAAGTRRLACGVQMRSTRLPGACPDSSPWTNRLTTTPMDQSPDAAATAIAHGRWSPTTTMMMMTKATVTMVVRMMKRKKGRTTRRNATTTLTTKTMKTTTTRMKTMGRRVQVRPKTTTVRTTTRGLGSFWLAFSRATCDNDLFSHLTPCETLKRYSPHLPTVVPYRTYRYGMQ